ncbi:MAG: hypothetical protein OXE41_08800 [Gammaproteobacteria bacterium]|nr:hypothetical protein [Gammaproteobacteria bacterium]MCY4219623.1 hypothetical protein [Gammaproteobacteria bacterium]MCY4275474.1 hypothetical protein [Gammaproteobacteria bacterium]
MLEILGTFAGNALSLPGILGLGFGMMTRQLYLAGVIGGLVGILESLIFSGFHLAEIGTLELTLSVLVGIVAGMIGCMIRRKGATV